MVKNLPAVWETWVQSLDWEDPWTGRKTCKPLQYSCLENPHGQRSLAGCSPWGHTELDTTEWLSIAGHIPYCTIFFLMVPISDLFGDSINLGMERHETSSFVTKDGQGGVLSGGRVSTRQVLTQNERWSWAHSSGQGSEVTFCWESNNYEAGQAVHRE